MRFTRPVDEEKLHQKIGQQAVEIDFLKKNALVRAARRLEMIDISGKKLSIRKQCDLLGVNRSRVYYKPAQRQQKAVVMMDYSRYVISWSVSNSLESLFCMDALDEALSVSKPAVFHSDQSSQYTSRGVSYDRPVACSAPASPPLSKATELGKTLQLAP